MRGVSLATTSVERSAGRLADTAAGRFGALAEPLARDDAAPLAVSDWCPQAVAAWGNDTVVDVVAAPPEAAPASSGRRKMALELVQQARQIGLSFAFVATDGAYRHLPWLLGELDDAGETFLAEMHPDRAVYLDDPVHAAADESLTRVRASLRLRTTVAPTSLVAWMCAQPARQWARLSIGDGDTSRGRGDYLTRRVWIWDGKSPAARHWHLLVLREVYGKALKFCLSNAAATASLRDLAEMRGLAMASSRPARPPRGRAAWAWS